MFSHNIGSNEMKNVLKGNYFEVLQNYLFLQLYGLCYIQFI